jgi:hypothetical protein
MSLGSLRKAQEQTNGKRPNLHWIFRRMTIKRTFGLDTRVGGKFGLARSLLDEVGNVHVEP